MSESQGMINGQITKLANRPDELKLFMKDKSDEQKKNGRIHLKMLKYLEKQQLKKRV